MKKLLLLPLMLLSVTMFAQGAFEGVITMTTTNAEIGETTQVKWALKGDRSRMDMQSSAEGQNTEYAIISDAKGIDMVAQGQVTPIPPASLRSSTPTLTLLDESEGHVVNGHKCVKRVYSDGKDDVTYWLADSLGISQSDLPMFLRRSMPRFESGLFPVRMEKRDMEGKVLMTQEVLAVTPQKVDDSLFAR
jgi:hypothetical protein